jgi:hypothetical protein
MGQPRPLSGKPDIEPTSSNEAKASKCWQQKSSDSCYLDYIS